MILYLLPADPLVILQLAPGGAKCIPQRNVSIRVGRVLRMCMSDYDLFAGHGEVNLEVEQRPLLVMLMVWRLDHDLAPDDLAAEALQLQG
jgi:hypothetical protein